MEPAKRFRVALSFPGEYRGRVEKIARGWRRGWGRERVLYDKWYAHELARPGLSVYLPDLYRKESELLVFFFCKQCGRRSGPASNGAQLSIFSKKKQYEWLMFLLVDDIDIADIPGLYPTDGYPDTMIRPAPRL
jgi:hypothetical protein